MGETVEVLMGGKVSEDTSGGSGWRRESNGDDGEQEYDGVWEQKDSITNHTAGKMSFTLSYSFIQSLSVSPRL